MIWIRFVAGYGGGNRKLLKDISRVEVVEYAVSK